MGLFSGTAPYYARFRPGYPQAFFSDVITRFALNGTGRSLDLGCGTGQLTIPLAEHVEQAVGLDPDPGMLAQAAQQARAAGARNLTWIQGDAADLAGELGRFRLVTMGRSFHWMDRERVLRGLTGVVEDDGRSDRSLHRTGHLEGPHSPPTPLSRPTRGTPDPTDPRNPRLRPTLEAADPADARKHRASKPPAFPESGTSGKRHSRNPAADTAQPPGREPGAGRWGLGREVTVRT